jgi:hypothetical protein
VDGFFAGVFEKSGVLSVVFCWWVCGGLLVNRGALAGVFSGSKRCHFLQVYFLKADDEWGRG